MDHRSVDVLVAEKLLDGADVMRHSRASSIPGRAPAATRPWGASDENVLEEPEQPGQSVLEAAEVAAEPLGDIEVTDDAGWVRWVR